MKSFLALLVFMPLFSQAANNAARCDLPVETGDEQFEDVGKALDIRAMNKYQLESLPTIIKQQLIIAAHADDSDDNNIKLVFTNANLLKAVAFLKEASEAEDLYVATVKFGRKQFSYVRYYPGGNEGGFIFTYNTTKLVAEVGDQWIGCLK